MSKALERAVRRMERDIHPIAATDLRLLQQHRLVRRMPDYAGCTVYDLNRRGRALLRQTKAGEP